MWGFVIPALLSIGIYALICLHQTQRVQIELIEHRFQKELETRAKDEEIASLQKDNMVQREKLDQAASEIEQWKQWAKDREAADRDQPPSRPRNEPAHWQKVAGGLWGSLKAAEAECALKDARIERMDLEKAEVVDRYERRVVELTDKLVEYHRRLCAGEKFSGLEDEVKNLEVLLGKKDQQERRNPFWSIP
ncbi:hypothetical protein NMY22_g11283 [Coprinellus aureogranulatus]|nr:hypothetical protein NMY22_g11283 [Coprinellus aureogranulatus]